MHRKLIDPCPMTSPATDPPTPEDNSVDKSAALCIRVPAPGAIHHGSAAAPMTRYWRPHRNSPSELRRWQASTLPTAPTTATDVLSIKRDPNYQGSGWHDTAATVGARILWEVLLCS